MRRRVLVTALLVVAALAALARPGGAAAHPLGNFTVNHYAGIELSGDRVFVHYVLDLAEIPTLQSGDHVRAPRYPAELARGLELRLDGVREPLEALTHRVTRRKGAGGLPTLRFEAVYGTRANGESLTFVDRTLRRPDRLARGDPAGA